jgi:DNA-binding transcriptional LysR family regulator
MRVEIADGRNLISGLEENYYDGIVIRRSMINHPEKYDLYRMATDEMAAILPADHRLAEESYISLTSLKNEFFYLSDPATQAFGICWNLLKSQHISTENVRTADIETILKSVAERRGVAILPISTLNVMKQEGVVTIPLQPRATLEVVFAVKKDQQRCEIMEYLIELIDYRSRQVPSV